MVCCKKTSLHDSIRLGHRACSSFSVHFNIVFFYIFVFYLRSVGYT